MYRSPLHCRCRLAPFISHNFPVLSLTSCLLPPACRWSQFPLFLCTPNCTWSWTWGTIPATCDSVIDTGATPPPPYEILGPISLAWILPFSSASQTISVGLAGFTKLQVTTPYTLVISRNNSSRGSNLQSTLYMWSSSLYGLIKLQYLAKCPCLSHNQRSVSVSPHHLIAQLPPSFPIQTVLYIVLLNWLYKSRYIQYVPWYHEKFLSQCINQSMNQFSNTQRSVTTVAYDELRWSSVSIKLPRTLILHLAQPKRSLSPVAAVCLHSVECVEGVGRIDNSPIRTG